MNHLKAIHDFLKAGKGTEAIRATGTPFVTISRQAGAGGHLLAHVLSTDLLNEPAELFQGWHVFDRELCEIVAKDPELNASLEELISESYKSEYADFFESLFTGRSRQYAITKKTFKVIRMLAALGKVIIVGRTSAFVTHSLPGGIHIRLVAPEQTRARWLMKKFKFSKEEALNLLHKQDFEREKLSKTYFNKDITDPINYDVVWNSETSDPHVISDSIIRMIKSRVAKQKQA
jgi:cytidylate kinase